MKPGQTMSKDGYQVCLYPLERMNITQWSSSDSYSHCCGHPFDVAFSGETQVPCYAPFDCHLSYSDNVGNTRAYSSDDKVWTPNGLSYVTVSFTHANNPPSATSYKQGDLIYYTGTSGYATGDHVHIDQTFTQNATLVSYGIYCSSGNLCYALQDSALPTEIFYVNDTTIIDGYGQDWKEFDGGSPTPTPEYEYIKHYFIMDGLGIDIAFYTEKREKPSPSPSPTCEWFIPEESRHLTEDESKQNWLAVWCYFKNKGWTAQAVSGMLGNMYYESSVNPNRWESDTPYISGGGFGLVQWTPYTKIVEWITNLGHWGQVSYYGDDECAKIQNEMETGAQWIATTTYPESFQSFSMSTESPYNLALEFLANYERPYDPNQPQRGTKALEIYEYIKDK